MRLKLKNRSTKNDAERRARGRRGTGVARGCELAQEEQPVCVAVLWRMQLLDRIPCQKQLQELKLTLPTRKEAGQGPPLYAKPQRGWNAHRTPSVAVARSTRRHTLSCTFQRQSALFQFGAFYKECSSLKALESARYGAAVL